MDLKEILIVIIVFAVGLFLMGAFVHMNPEVFGSVGAFADISHGFYHLVAPGP